MFRPPEPASPTRKILLAPLALAYAGGCALHRWIGLRPAPPFPSLPLIVIGSLRAGGAGKTAVTLELARYLNKEGKRVGILAYRIRGAEDLEIGSEAEWRNSSDEAVLLARRSGARVFATRNRAALWRRLDRTGEFDVLLADDGLMDARLAGAFRTALVRPGENPGWRDLLPAGPYRLTAAALKHADFTLEFSRKIVMPKSFDFSRRYWMLSGMGNPAAFRTDLKDAGIQVAGSSAGPNHGLPALEKARFEARSASAAGFLFSAKDAVKVAGLLGTNDEGIEIGESIALPPAFLSAVEAFLAPPSS